MNFYEKALFVKPTWRLVAAERNASALRAMLLSALSGSSHSLGGSVHRMRSVLVRTNQVLQSSERSLLCRVDQVRLRSHLMLDPKRIRATKPWPSATLGSLPLWQVSAPPLLCLP